MYVVIAAISSRISHVVSVITAILSGDVQPTHTYLMLSDHKFLLDEGVPRTKIPVILRFLVATGYLTIVYTDNIGPHRKLLPILAKMWLRLVAFYFYLQDGCD